MSNRDDDRRLELACGRLKTSFERLRAEAALPLLDAGSVDSLEPAIAEAEAAALAYGQAKSRVAFKAGIRATLEMSLGPPGDRLIGGPHPPAAVKPWEDEG